MTDDMQRMKQHLRRVILWSAGGPVVRMVGLRGEEGGGGCPREGRVEGVEDVEGVQEGGDPTLHCCRHQLLQP